jgi:transposase
MDVIHQRVGGLDVHKALIVACVRILTGIKVERVCRTFDTTTAGLLDLLAWLTERGCTHVAMEATGVYWKPVWNILSDGRFELMVANARHIKNVPGRKTDMNDAMWIADLVACGLIRASFVADEAQQELRSLMRTSKQLGREQTRHVQRLQRTLEEANIKLDSVISDLLGVSGRRMIEAMIEGVRSPRKLADLADRRLKASPKQLYDALHGRLTEHHRFLLRLHLRQYDTLAAAIQQIDGQVEAQLARMDQEVTAGQAPFRTLIRRLSAIPGVSVLSAITILAEIGRDMSRFPTAGHLIAWARAVPRSERKRRQAQIIQAAKGRTLAEDDAGAMCLGGKNQKNSYFKAQFHRLTAHRDLSHAEEWHFVPGSWC